MTPKEVLAMCRQNDVKAVDLRFTDWWGTLRHLTIPISRLSEETFEAGLCFEDRDLSVGDVGVEQDLLAIPEPETAHVDPFAELPTLAMTCNLQDPVAGESYLRDPRSIAQRAVTYLQSTGVADTAYFGSRVSFFVFEHVSFGTEKGQSYFCVETPPDRKARGSSGLNSGANDRMESLRSIDPDTNVRNRIMALLSECGIEVDRQCQESDLSCHAGLDLSRTALVRSADAIATTKYIVKRVAREYGKFATFMPKPLGGTHASSLYLRLSLWKGDQPLLAGNGFEGLSEVGIYAVGGILRHAAALAAFVNPTTNSYKRLGMQCPAMNLTYSRQGGASICRVPSYSSDPKAKRIEYRCPDPSCNPYLAQAATLMAALDGIQSKIHPGEPHSSEKPTPADMPVLPRDLESALSALASDYDFLLKGDVFSKKAIDAWIAHKTEREIRPQSGEPHPQEFRLYFNA